MIAAPKICVHGALTASTPPSGKVAGRQSESGRTRRRSVVPNASEARTHELRQPFPAVFRMRRQIKCG